MCDRVEIDTITAREKQRDLHQAEQDRPIRLAPAGRETRVQAGRRTWDRLKCWLDPLCLSGRADRRSNTKDNDPYLLNALAWMMAKE